MRAFPLNFILILYSRALICDSLVNVKSSSSQGLIKSSCAACLFLLACDGSRNQNLFIFCPIYFLSPLIMSPYNAEPIKIQLEEVLEAAESYNLKGFISTAIFLYLLSPNHCMANFLVQHSIKKFIWRFFKNIGS